MEGFELTEELAAKIVDCVFHAVQTEFPNVLDGSRYEKPPNFISPRTVHPIFFGCFDWHSAVHSHWTILRLLKKHPMLAIAPQIGEYFNSTFTTSNIRTEVESLKFFGASYETPYGMSWLLSLLVALQSSDMLFSPEVYDALGELTLYAQSCLTEWMKGIDLPDMTGLHRNTAFSLSLLVDTAQSSGNKELLDLIHATATRLYLNSQIDLPVEDNRTVGHSFLSPALCLLDLMRKLDLLDTFIAGTVTAHIYSLSPVENLNPVDGYASHNIGLNFTRSWCYAGLASCAGEQNDSLPNRSLLVRLAQDHMQASFGFVGCTHWMTAHWTNTFLLNALEHYHNFIASPDLTSRVHS